MSTQLNAASGTLTGIPALIVILVILALIIIGIVAVVRAAGRKAKDTLGDR